MVPGKTVTIGNAEYVLPALTLGQLRNSGIDLLKQNDALVKENGDIYAAHEIKGKLILMALQRNYPEITEAFLFDNLDMANIIPLWLTVMGASGFNPGEAEAEKTPPTVNQPGT